MRYSAPNFKISNLWPLFRNENSIYNYFKHNKNPKFISGYLSRSTWFLILISIWRKKSFSNQDIIIYVPDYFCNTTLLPLRIFKIKIIFYKINQNFSPDINNLKKMLKLNVPDILLISHYFGEKHNFAEEIKNLVLDIKKKENIETWVVEDFAHTIPKNFDNKNFFGDFIFFSPHKIFPIPFGSFLVLNLAGINKINFSSLKYMYETSSWSDQLLLELKKKKVYYETNLFKSILWLIKRFCQKFLYFNQVTHNFNYNYSEKNIQNLVNPKLDSLSEFFLKVIKINFHKELDFKLRLILMLKNYLENSVYSTQVTIVNEINHFRIFLPYMAIIKVKKNSKEIYNYLRSKNLSVISWPDLAPETAHDQELQKLKNSFIFVTLNDYLKIKKHETDSQNFNNIKLVKTNITKKKWDIILKNLDESNILQSWFYGEVKEKIEKFKVQRIIFTNNRKILGCCQILLKTYLGFITFYRINRGPIFKRNVSNEDKKFLLKILLKNINKKFVNIFYLTPNFIFNEAFIFFNKNLFYRPNSWISSTIDLSNDVKNIVNNCSRSWKKDLIKSQKNSLKVFIDNNNEDFFNWILRKYSLSFKKKKFSSLNLSIIQELYKNKNTLIVCICKKYDDIIGGMILFKHGQGVTSLLNELNDDGREMCANNLIFYELMQYLKKSNFIFWDLGGIDFAKTPGASNFKLSISKNTYELVGSIIIVN